MQLTGAARDRLILFVINGTKRLPTDFIYIKITILQISQIYWIQPYIFKLRPSNKMWQHVFRSVVGSYIFIFSWVSTWFIFCFLLHVVIIHLLQRWEGVGIYYPLIPDWIESTQEQILFPPQIQNGDTEPNSKYRLKEYFNIAYSKHPNFIYILWLQLHTESLVLDSFLEPIPNITSFLNLNHVLNTLISPGSISI